MRRSISMKHIVIVLLLGGMSLFVAVVNAPAEGPSEEELKAANNPLANFTALNIQNYYIPSLYDLPDKSVNTGWIRLRTICRK